MMILDLFRNREFWFLARKKFASGRSLHEANEGRERISDNVQESKDDRCERGLLKNTNGSLFLGGTLLFLSACSHDLGRPIVERKSIEKEHYQDVVFVTFSKDKRVLSESERLQILNILNAYNNADSSEKVSIHVTLLVSGLNATQNGSEAIKSFLLEIGIQEKRIHIKRQSSEKGSSSGNIQNVKILIDVYKIIAPVCLNWKVPLGSAEGSMPYANYGCTDAMNFYLMIEDPAVLWQGQKPGPSDTKREADIVKKYNEDKPLDLKSTSSTTSMSGSSTSPSTPAPASPPATGY